VSNSTAQSLESGRLRPPAFFRFFTVPDGEDQDSGFRVVHGAVFDVNDGLTTQTSFVRRLGGEADYPARVPERVMPFSSGDAGRVKPLNWPQKLD
jgi:hypothetical protein